MRVFCSVVVVCSAVAVSGECLFDDFREVLLFKLADFAFNVIRSVGGIDGYGFLEYNASAVIFFADHVYGYSGFRVAGVKHCLVDVASVHAFATVAWEK